MRAWALLVLLGLACVARPCAAYRASAANTIGTRTSSAEMQDAADDDDVFEPATCASAADLEASIGRCEMI